MTLQYWISPVLMLRRACRVQAVFLVDLEVGDLTCRNSKLEMVKTISTPRKINAILLNIKLNRPKLVRCRYILAINWQNFTELYLAKVKILQNVFFWGGGYFFDSHCIRETLLCIIF